MIKIVMFHPLLDNYLVFDYICINFCIMMIILS